MRVNYCKQLYNVYFKYWLSRLLIFRAYLHNFELSFFNYLLLRIDFGILLKCKYH